MTLGYNLPMNVFIVIMLVFAAIGFTDKALGGRWGLSEQFDRGLYTMGTMAIPIVSICAVGTEFIRRHTDQISSMSDHIFFDPSMIIGAILAPDMGGFFICREITSDPKMLVFSGVILGTLLGQAITFQLPVFMQSVDREDHPDMFRGFIVGIIMIPAGLIAAEIMIRLPMAVFIRQLAPVFILCLIIAAGLKWAPDGTAKVFAVFAVTVNWGFYVMFAVTVIGLFVPKIAYASLDSVEEAVLIVFKSAVIIAGSLVMSEMILKLFRKQVNSVAERIGINEVAVVSLLMTCATSLAVMPLFGRMDRKGKQVVSAFSLSGSFVIGGSLAFVSNVSNGYTTTVFVVSKLVCAILSALVIHRLFRSDSRT